MSELSYVLSLTAVLSFILLLSFWGWKKIWFDQFGGKFYQQRSTAELPIDRNILTQEVNRKRLFARTKTPGIFWNMYSQLVQKLEMEYWITHCGNDGYLYLLFQRRFLSLTLYLSVISVVMSLAMNLLYSDNKVQDQDYGTFLGQFFDKAALKNQELSNKRGWFHVVMMFAYSFLTINFVQKTRRDAKISYQMYYSEMSKKRDHEWLKARTLHVKGIPEEDRAGNGLKTLIEKFLKENGGRIICMQIVPPFHKIFDIEVKIRDLRDLNMMMITQNENTNCCIPKKYKDYSYVESQLEKYEEQLLQETMQPFLPSGHAFVCFDSVRTTDAVIAHFQPSTRQFLLHLQYQIKDYCCCFRRNRSKSAHQKFDELQAYELAQKYDDAVIVMSRTTEPSDILWRNMKGVRGLFIFRRVILFTIGLLIVFFLSSPAVIFMQFKKLDSNNIFNMSWTDNLPGGNLIRRNLPPLIIITINQILLQLIDIVSIIESYETHSLYQNAVYMKSVIYLNLNMLIIPALTLTQNMSDPKQGQPQSLWQFIITKNYSPTELLAEFYTGNYGQFFVTLVIQQACLSTAYYILNLNDIINSYASPWLAHMKRKVFQDQEPWLRKELNTFCFGYFYALTITVFAICVFFSSTVPLIPLACAFFVFVKHICDSLNLITVFRKEIDSQGLLIETATNTCLIVVVAYQVCMMAYLTIKEKDDEALICTLIFIISIIYIVISYDKVNDVGEYDFDASNIKMTEVERAMMLEQWRAEYDHPSVVSKNKIKSQILLNDVFKDIDSWEKFKQDTILNKLWEPSNYPRDSGMFAELYPLRKMSPDQKKRFAHLGMSSERIRKSQQNVQQKYYMSAEANPQNHSGLHQIVEENREDQLLL